MQDPVMKEAKNALDRLSEDPEVQELAERRRISLAFYQHDVQAAREEGRAEGKAEGRAEGEAMGRAEAQRVAVARLCDVLGIELDDRRHREIAAMSDAELENLLDTLTRERRWPAR